MRDYPTGKAIISGFFGTSGDFAVCDRLVFHSGSIADVLDGKPPPKSRYSVWDLGKETK
jgi:hypothetical protein